ncbi:MAG: IMP cyclohydrolase, partial [Fibrobacter sp.]|nr:IMP cyclohydrolase [Fibrobacter sp.]
MSYTDEAKNNFKELSKNPYPGRGIVLGTSPDGKSFVQVYWIMGRSVNSRNRVFEME